MRRIGKALLQNSSPYIELLKRDTYLKLSIMSLPCLPQSFKLVPFFLSLQSRRLCRTECSPSM